MNLIGTTDKVSMNSQTAVNLDVVASFEDLLFGQIGQTSAQRVESGGQRTAFTTATTLDIVNAPAAATTVRRVSEITIRNKSLGTTDQVTVQVNQGGTLYEVIQYVLQPGQSLFYKDGIGWVAGPVITKVLSNIAQSAQTGFAADTYLLGSNILLPTGAPIVGTTYKLKFDLTKTGAGSAAPTVTLRIGTGASTSDTSRLVYTFGVGTAVIDSGVFEILASFRSVGTSTAAVIQGIGEIKHQLASTGITSTGTAGYAVITPTSSGFDSTTPTNAYIGVSYNGGASAAHTINLVRAELVV